MKKEYDFSKSKKNPYLKGPYTRARTQGRVLAQCSMGAMMVFRQALGGLSGHGEIRPDFSQDH